MIDYRRIKPLKLNNGLKVIDIYDPHSTSVMCGIYVPYGSNMLEYRLSDYQFKSGIAHFLEHRIFDTPQGDAFALFSQEGLSSNAYTSFTETVYYFEGPRKNYLKGLEILLSFISKMEFDPSHVDKEKGIILSERQLDYDDPDHRSYMKILQNLYNAPMFQKDILGSKEDIQSVTYQDLKKTFDTFYATENLYLIIVGNYNRDDVLSLCAKYEKKRTFKPVAISKTSEDFTKAKRQEGHLKGDVSRPLFYYAIKLDKRALEKQFSKERLFFLLRIYLEGNFLQCSRFYEAMKKEDLIDTSFNGFIDQVGDYLTLIFTAESERYLELKTALETEVAHPRIDEETFEAIKKGLYGNLLQLSSNEELFNRICGSLSLNIDFFQLARKKMQITYSMLQSLIDIIHTSPRTWCVTRKR